MVVTIRGRQVRLLDLASAPVLVAYIVGGFLALTVEPPNLVEVQLGPKFVVLWAVMLIAGPVMWFASIPMADQYLGVQLRASAGVLTMGGVGTFAACAGIVDYTSFAFVIATGLACAALSALLVDLRQLRMIRRLAHELP